ncbi:MAG: radical SAM family heme chaperone HemW [Pseudomonadota bacterium]
MLSPTLTPTGAPVSDPATNDLGVYVHWPYCLRICPYCDFNVYKNRDVDASAWQGAFARQLTQTAAMVTPRPLHSLYFGGGTPSLAPLPILRSVIDQCETLFGFHPGAEITLEANPANLTRDQMQDVAALGITRLSLGVQSFDDRLLKVLGRDHNCQQASAAIDAAQSIFGNVTFDLIYGHPDQSLDQWQAELTHATQFETGHLSVYQLTIEPHTAYGRAVDRGRMIPKDGDVLADFDDLAMGHLSAHGFDRYEISNLSRPGFEAIHNLIYWRYQDYIGIGPGAHGRLTLGDNVKGHAPGTRIETCAPRRPEVYLESQTAENFYEIFDPLDAEAQMQERFAMGLRLRAGIALTRDDHFFTDEERTRALALACADGLARYDNCQLVPTDRGRKLLNRLLDMLLAPVAG